MPSTLDMNCGASPAAIQHHYDVGNDFYRLWLGSTLTYSCALWQDGDTDDMLEVAQKRKVAHHVQRARARGAARVLDVGCGWGTTLQCLADEAGVRQPTGLTLSREQAAFINSLGDPRLQVRLEGWADHVPSEPYDAVVSIGAFEHFARAHWSDAWQVAVYRQFFERCHSWLRPGGWLSLQTIVLGNVDPVRVADTSEARFIEQEIFPESSLPTVEQVVRASDGCFELVELRNDREDYERTCRVWLDRLKARRAEAVEVAGGDVVARYLRYLKVVAALFHYGYIGLLRCAFRRNDELRQVAKQAA